MKILIDGDSCKVLRITEHLAKQYRIPCHVFCNSSKSINTRYAEIHITDCQKDAADFAIINACTENDIVITNDSGLAALILAKKGTVIGTHGNKYTDDNIIGYLNRRYVRNIIVKQTGRKQVKGQLYDNLPSPVPYRETLIQAMRENLRKETVNV